MQKVDGTFFMVGLFSCLLLTVNVYAGGIADVSVQTEHQVRQARLAFLQEQYEELMRERYELEANLDALMEKHDFQDSKVYKQKLGYILLAQKTLAWLKKIIDVSQEGGHLAYDITSFLGNETHSHLIPMACWMNTKIKKLLQEYQQRKLLNENSASTNIFS